MASVIANIIWRGGKIVNCPAQQFTCSGEHMIGHIVPIGDCCDSSTEWKLNQTSGLSTNPNAIYGIITQVDGETVLLDVQGGVEVAATPMTLPILAAKLVLISNECACTDCTALDPTPVIPAVYDGVYPALTSTSACFNVVVAVAPTGEAVNSFNRRYLGRISKSTITSVGANTFTVKVTAIGTQLQSRDAIDTVSSTTC